MFIVFQPPQMGSVPVMTQPSLIYSQPVMRPPNPFGPGSGAQVPIDMLRVTCTLLDVEEIEYQKTLLCSSEKQVVSFFSLHRG